MHILYKKQFVGTRWPVRFMACVDSIVLWIVISERPAQPAYPVFSPTQGKFSKIESPQPWPECPAPWFLFWRIRFELAGRSRMLRRSFNWFDFVTIVSPPLLPPLLPLLAHEFSDARPASLEITFLELVAKIIGSVTCCWQSWAFGVGGSVVELK